MSNGTTVNEWEVCGRNRSWPNLIKHPGICPDKLKKTKKNQLLQDDSIVSQPKSC